MEYFVDWRGGEGRETIVEMRLSPLDTVAAIGALYQPQRIN
jgi:hypothetical protein